jgi:hypothetical protein
MIFNMWPKAGKRVGAVKVTSLFATAHRHRLFDVYVQL